MAERETLFSGPVPPEAAGIRLDVFLSEALAERGLSRGRIQGFIKDGLAELDGRVVAKPNTRLAGGEELHFQGAVDDCAIEPEAAELRILHADARLAVIDKPAGLTVHPAPGCPEGTLVHRLLHHFPAMREAGFGDSPRPGIVHRLDKDTSGVMLVALDEPTRIDLAEAFAERRVEKEYLALVCGVPGETGEIDAPIGRDPDSKVRMAVLAKGGRPALSRYRTIWAAADGSAALVRVRIFTGRTHQIRVHLAHVGHPILGDTSYGGREWAELVRRWPRLAVFCTRQMLHAWRLGFTHPETGEARCFLVPPPRDFLRAGLALTRRAQRVCVTGAPGSGKSLVLRELAALGLPTFSADASVARAYEPGGDGWLLIRGRFGDRFVPSEDAPVDRRRLFEAMREDAQIRKEVMEMIHPLVHHDLQAFWRDHAGARAAVAEIPLLFEVGWGADDCDVVVGVRADGEARARRMASGRAVSAETLAVLESWQWPAEDKLARCDEVVDNTGSMEATRGAVRSLQKRLAERRRERMRSEAAGLARLMADPGQSAAP